MADVDLKKAPESENESASLRELLDVRRAVHELLHGSMVLVRRGTVWVAAGEGWQGSARRLGAVAAAIVVAARATGDYPVILTVAVAGWCVAAWVLPSVPYSPTKPSRRSAGTSATGESSSPAAEEAEYDEDVEDGAEESPASPADADPDAVFQLVRDTAVSFGHKAAHLEDVVVRGQREGLLTGWDKTRLRDQLEGWGIPVEDQLKLRFGGRPRNRAGVRLAALPAPAPAPSEGPAPAVPEGAVSDPAPAASEPSPPPSPEAVPGAG